MSDFYEPYLKVCQEAVDNEDMFKTFKGHCDYRLVLEHTTFEQGQEYLNEIEREFPYLLQFMPQFIKNDEIGNPDRYFYEKINIEISPTTLRYIKILSDLLNLFGRLDDMNIVEIGCGYGGQCKIIHCFSQPKSYTLIDRYEALLLSKKYLEYHEIKNIILRETNDEAEIHYDLCISNYAFAEIPRIYQNLYAQKVIKNSDIGYMICNIFGDGNPDNPMTREDIFSLKEKHMILPEKPLTWHDNLIYVWNDKSS